METATQPEKYIGEILFSPRCQTFFRVDSVTRYTEEQMGGAVFLDMTDLSGEISKPAFEPEEIGEELFIVQEDFPREKIDRYIEFAKRAKAAKQSMHDIAMGIANYHAKESEDQIPF